MVWACEKNGWVTYGQKIVDGRNKWRAGTRETEVRLDGWCDSGLGQQRNNGGGCVTMRERSERVESPGTYVTEWDSRSHFWLALCPFAPPSRALVVITWRRDRRRYMMRLGWTVKRVQLLKTKVYVPSIWAKGWMFEGCVCVLSDLTWLPFIGWGRKSWYNIIIMLNLYYNSIYFNSTSQSKQRESQEKEKKTFGMVIEIWNIWICMSFPFNSIYAVQALLFLTSNFEYKTFTFFLRF